MVGLMKIYRSAASSLNEPKFLFKGDKGSAVVTMQNAGNIAMEIDVSVRCFDDQGRKLTAASADAPLKVWPSKILVPPHQKTKDVIVKFTPDKEYHKTAPCRGIVLLKVGMKLRLLLGESIDCQFFNRLSVFMY